jgi:hypothetical protein
MTGELTCPSTQTNTPSCFASPTPPFSLQENRLTWPQSGEYGYFDAFTFLPPRSLKDYYEIIAEPLSLKALQKQVRGQHGRNEATGVSDFKTWSQFEDQASLLWKNAYHYNEDGSEIFQLAQELEVGEHQRATNGMPILTQSRRISRSCSKKQSNMSRSLPSPRSSSRYPRVPQQQGRLKKSPFMLPAARTARPDRRCLRMLNPPRAKTLATALR